MVMCRQVLRWSGNSVAVGGSQGSRGGGGYQLPRRVVVWLQCCHEICVPLYEYAHD